MNFFRHKRTTLIAIALLSSSCVVTGIIGYSSMEKQRNELQIDWEMLCAQYKTRLTMVPQLVVSTRDLIGTKRKMYERLATARKNLTCATNPYQKSYAHFQLDAALQEIIDAADGDPKIKKKRSYNVIVQDLLKSGHHMNVLASRYNEEVEKFNYKLQTMPYKAIGALFHISKAPYALRVE